MYCWWENRFRGFPSSFLELLFGFKKMDFVGPEEAGRKLLRNVGDYMPTYKVTRPTKSTLETKI